MNVWYSFSAHFVEKPSNFDERDNFTYEDIDHEEYNIGKLEKHLEKVLKCNKRGFHRKKSSNDEVTNSTSTQQDVHFGQGLRKFGNRGKGYGNNNDINEELNFHAPSSALEGNMLEKNFLSIWQNFVRLGLLNILCGALLNMPDASIEKACGIRSNQSLMVCFH